MLQEVDRSLLSILPNQDGDEFMRLLSKLVLNLGHDEKARPRDQEFGVNP